MDTPYRGRLIADAPDADEFRRILPDCRAIVISVMEALAARFDTTSDYPFIDTKIDLLTGAEFPINDPIRGRGGCGSGLPYRALPD